MPQLQTLYSSNIPIDCHILKGRLESEGIPAFVFDEHIVWVDPFRAVAVGGVKLKVPDDQFIHCQKILESLKRGDLFDELETYEVSEILNNEIRLQNEILSIKHQIRNSSLILDKNILKDSSFMEQIDAKELLEEERVFREFSEKEFQFSWKDFWYELFDFERSIFRYFRSKPVDYYLEKDLVEHYIHPKESKKMVTCPQCASENTSYGYAMDCKWDVLYLVLSFFLLVPMFPYRKKHHCFDCGHNFKKTSIKLD